MATRASPYHQPDNPARTKGFQKPDRAGELRVKDVCVRHGQGTASLGLPRYYVLIEGPSKDATDDLIIEFKRARRSDIDLDALSYGTWKDYARVCGTALAQAQAHALSDDLGQIDYNVDPSIVAAASPRRLFIADVVRFTEEAADRLEADHASFCEDHSCGAFDSIDMVYR